MVNVEIPNGLTARLVDYTMAIEHRTVNSVFLADHFVVPPMGVLALFRAIANFATSYAVLEFDLGLFRLVLVTIQAELLLMAPQLVSPQFSHLRLELCILLARFAGGSDAGLVIFWWLKIRDSNFFEVVFHHFWLAVSANNCVLRPAVSPSVNRIALELDLPLFIEVEHQDIIRSQCTVSDQNA